MADDMRVRYKGSEKSLVSWLVDTVKRRCDTTLQPALLGLRAQRYGDETYPDVKRMSEAILETCPPGAAPPEDLETAILYASDTLRLRREYTVLRNLPSDQGHDDWMNILHGVREVLRTINDNSIVPAAPRRDSPYGPAVSEPAQGTSAERSSAERLEIEKMTSVLVAFQKIEQFVLDTWREFKAGATPLSAAADITFAAIGLIHGRAISCIDEIRPDRLKDAVTAYRICSEANELLLSAAHAHEGPAPDSSELWAYHQIMVMSDLMKQHETPVGPLGSYSYGTSYGGDSLVMSSFHKFHAQGTISLELILYVQLYLSLYKLLGPDHIKVHEASNQVACAIGDGMAEYLEMRKDRRFHAQSEFPVDDEDTKDLEQIICIASGTRSTARKMSGKDPLSFETIREESIDQHIECSKAPLNASNLLGQLLHINQCDALLINRKTRFVELMGYLYAACKRSSHLEPVWGDMDFAIKDLGLSGCNLDELDTESDDSDVNGSIPADALQHILPVAKHFSIAMGMPTSRFSATADLVASAAVLLTADEAYPSEGSSLGAALSRLSSIQRSGLTDGMRRQEAVHELVDGALKRLLKYYGHLVDQKIKDAYDTSGIVGLDDVTMLSIVKQVSVQGALSLHFNYRKFFMHCTVMLKLIKRETNNLVAAARAKRGLSQSFTYREMVDEILWSAAIGTLDPQKPAYASGQLLGLAAEVIKVAMPSYGSPCYDAAESFMRSGQSQAAIGTDLSITPPDDRVALASHQEDESNAPISPDSSTGLTSPVFSVPPARIQAFTDWLDASYELDPSADIKQTLLWNDYCQRYDAITNEEELEILQTVRQMSDAQMEQFIAVLLAEFQTSTCDGSQHASELPYEVQLKLLAFVREISGKAQKVPPEPLLYSAAELVMQVASYFSGARAGMNASNEFVIKGIKTRGILAARGSLNGLKLILDRQTRLMRAAETTTINVSGLLTDKPSQDSGPGQDTQQAKTVFIDRQLSFSRSRSELRFDRSRFRVKLPGTSVRLYDISYEQENEQDLAWQWKDYVEVGSKLLGPPVVAGTMVAWLVKRVGR